MRRTLAVHRVSGVHTRAPYTTAHLSRSNERRLRRKMRAIHFCCACGNYNHALVYCALPIKDRALQPVAARAHYMELCRFSSLHCSCLRPLSRLCFCLCFCLISLLCTRLSRASVSSRLCFCSASARVSASSPSLAHLNTIPHALETNTITFSMVNL